MDPESAPRIPRHIAIVMDGNGRWAERRRRPRSFGHREGQKAVRAAVEFCLRRGVEALTLFAFSSENWNRPQAEIDALFDLLRVFVKRDLARLHKDGVRIRIVGSRDGLSDDILALIDEAVDKNKLDAIVGPSNAPTWMIDTVSGDCGSGYVSSSSMAAVAGYPNITVPAGFAKELLGLGIQSLGKFEQTLGPLGLGQLEIDPASLLAATHQPRVAEDLDVPRYARLALAEQLRQLADRQLHGTQQRKDAQPRWVGERLEKRC